MPTFPAERKISDPALNPGDEPYFEAAADGALLVKACNSCGKVHHYPRAICPFCWSTDLKWTQTSGKGQIYTYSVTRRGAGAPYCIAYVTLDEGPTLMTNIVDTDLDEVKIGQRVDVVFKRSENGTAVPMFTPSAGSTREESA
ncbi:Zn-ribbon domain-containing OB-fold protein [Cupriavidus pinatubonensis]|uniref:Zn-ribbon domain-containing OB-fold protein n=1 Tax=Cupriavidus pinatubonensis TaxID=248026 RepID=UPI0011263BE1|nr:Zn-ribbon domain-containing OB-fold protein [Cupriavidus pinatubonensis]TPQ38249.1 DNA-binding protein [Cupriavidus pinatubonensis]